MQKSNIRSFRYSDKVKEIIENFNGNNMNEKFENLVLHCFDSVPKVEKRLKDLDKNIKKKQNIFSDLSNEVYELDSLMKELAVAKKSLEFVSASAKNISFKYESINL